MNIIFNFFSSTKALNFLPKKLKKHGCQITIICLINEYNKKKLTQSNEREKKQDLIRVMKVKQMSRD